MLSSLTYHKGLRAHNIKSFCIWCNPWYCCWRKVLIWNNQCPTLFVWLFWCFYEKLQNITTASQTIMLREKSEANNKGDRPLEWYHDQNWWGCLSEICVGTFQRLLSQKFVHIGNKKKASSNWIFIFMWDIHATKIFKYCHMGSKYERKYHGNCISMGGLFSGVPP